MDGFFINQKGTRLVTVGGVRMLTDFLPDEITLVCVGANVTITGEKLEILRFDANEIIIKGSIENVNTMKRASRGIL